MNISQILNISHFTKENIITLLKAEGDDRKLLFETSAKVKEEQVGKFTYFRGLVEFSNMCAKNCLYCGIRRDNKNVSRYNLSDDEIIEAAKFAHENDYASLVLQAGELAGEKFAARVEQLLEKIMAATNGELGITLSLGEQPREVYERWKKAGARRYLLRIESSSRELYYKIHPNDAAHDFDNRLRALLDLKESGYQTGTGIMVGLPFQDYGHLADDLLFMHDFDIDMCGMGPYIEHPDTPLYEHRGGLMPLKDRFGLTLKMIAVLRIMMKDINIAAATALQAIDPIGREKALKIGANVMMPNITPGRYRDDYKLYTNKPCTDEEASDCMNCMEARITIAGDEIGYGRHGDSLHWERRSISG